jgi:hypothetical protein
MSMRLSSMKVLLGSFVLLVASALLPAQAVQLADGRLLLATVEEADGEGLRIRRLDNGGTLDLRWDHLSTASATEWKRKFDLVGETQDEILVRAEEVEYVRAGGKQTIIGRITNPQGDPLLVQVKGVLYPVPRNELGPVRKVEVPASQIFTKDEFYAMRRSEVQPGESADRHVLLAEDLIKFRDYDRAAEHLQKAKDLGNARDGQRIEVLLQRLQRFKEAQKELGVLESIQASRSRGTLVEFEKGMKAIEQFERDFPQSKLKAEFEREKKRFLEARQRYLTQQVADQFRRSIGIVAEKKVSEDGVTIQSARDYAGRQMTDDIVDRVAKLLRLDATEVRQMWGERAKYPVGKRSEHFNYGLGSWVLGEPAIVKDTAVGKAKDKQSGQGAPAAQDSEIDRFAKLLQQAMQRRRQSVQGGGEESRQMTEEDWWRDASRAERVSWLKAYYAEFGGQLVVTFASTTPCISCYGQGTTPEMGDGGKVVQAKCFLCQQTKWLRSFKAY